jgi:hypothetical protein
MCDDCLSCKADREFSEGFKEAVREIENGKIIGWLLFCLFSCKIRSISSPEELLRQVLRTRKRAIPLGINGQVWMVRRSLLRDKLRDYLGIKYETDYDKSYKKALKIVTKHYLNEKLKHDHNRGRRH